MDNNQPADTNTDTDISENHVNGSGSPETAIENGSGDLNNQENTNPGEEAKEPFYKKHKKEPSHIPYTRFKEKVDESARLRAENEELRAKYEARHEAKREEPTHDNTSSDDDSDFPDILDYPDHKSYQNAIAKHFAEKSAKSFDSMYNTRIRTEKEHNEITNIATKYEKAITEASKSDPDLMDAYGVLENVLSHYNDRIDKNLVKKILSDPMAVELTKFIASDEQHLRNLVGDRDALVESIAEFKAEHRYRSKVADEAPVRPGVPKSVKGAASTNAKEWDGRGGVAGLMKWKKANGYM